MHKTTVSERFSLNELFKIQQEKQKQKLKKINGNITKLHSSLMFRQRWKVWIRIEILGKNDRIGIKPRKCESPFKIYFKLCFISTHWKFILTNWYLVVVEITVSYLYNIHLCEYIELCTYLCSLFSHKLKVLQFQERLYNRSTSGYCTDLNWQVHVL